MLPANSSVPQLREVAVSTSMSLATSERGASRILAIDSAKGALVVLMVVYHTLNYLDYGSLPHDYMAFLPASFTLLAGFLVGVAHVRHSVGNRRWEALHLVVRAARLIALFTCF